MNDIGMRTKCNRPPMVQLAALALVLFTVFPTDAQQAVKKEYVFRGKIEHVDAVGLRLEPTIMGEVRGAGARHDQGGRPRNAKHPDLIMHLATDWISATGEAPKSGRSDYTGFGELVHSIFQWLDLPEGSAVHSLRQYWADAKERKKRPNLENFLKRQGEPL